MRGAIVPHRDGGGAAVLDEPATPPAEAGESSCRCPMKMSA
jgi:hypothetical protein